LEPLTKTLTAWMELGKSTIWVLLFLVSPKHSQVVDHSMTIKNYAFYSSTPFKYNFKEKFQYPIQNAKEQEILNTFDNSFFDPLLLKKKLSPTEI
jgi:hypothetical protein